MWFWRDTYFQTLKDVAAEAGASAELADYAAYCREYERGLRREAFRILERFIARMERVPFVDRRRFVSWLLHRADLRDGNHMLAPYPLRNRIIEPTLDEWLRVEPSSSEPHRWLGGYEHLKRAIELDAFDEIARRRFIGCILGTLDYDTHKLPYGYLGNPADDLSLLAEAEVAMSGLAREDDRRIAAAEITELRRLIEGYLHGKSEGDRSMQLSDSIGPSLGGGQVMRNVRW